MTEAKAELLQKVFASFFQKAAYPNTLLNILEKMSNYKIHIRAPSLSDEHAVSDYIREFNQDAERSGYTAMQEFDDFSAWLDELTVFPRFELEPELRISGGYIPVENYFAFSQDCKLVGMIAIRLELNAFLRTDGGNIGYSVLPSFRNRGVASAMLSFALKRCCQLGIPLAVITTESDDIASASVAEKNGGKLESEFYSRFFQQNIKRYVIALPHNEYNEYSK